MIILTVECKTVFTKSRFKADELVRVKVYFRSSAPLSINLRKLKLLFMKEVSASTYTLLHIITQFRILDFPLYFRTISSSGQLHMTEVCRRND